MDQEIEDASLIDVLGEIEPEHTEGIEELLKSRMGDIGDFGNAFRVMKDLKLRVRRNGWREGSYIEYIIPENEASYNKYDRGAFGSLIRLFDPISEKGYGWSPNSHDILMDDWEVFDVDEMNGLMEMEVPF